MRKTRNNINKITKVKGQIEEGFVLTFVIVVPDPGLGMMVMSLGTLMGSLPNDDEAPEDDPAFEGNRLGGVADAPPPLLFFFAAPLKKTAIKKYDFLGTHFIPLDFSLTY